jgi:ABC-2 type transport system permease protein
VNEVAATQRAAVPLQAFAKLVLYEARLAWRSPRGLAFGIGLPVTMLVLFGQLPYFKEHPASLGGFSRFDVEVPVLAALVIAALALLVLAGPLTSYRERGILRRMSTTPMRPGWLLAAQLVVNLALVAIALIILFVLAVAAFGMAAPKDLGALLLSLALCTFALFAVGLFMAALAPTSGSLVVFEAASFVPLMFLAGLWVPIQEMPTALRDISKYTPLGAAVQAAQDSIQGIFPPAQPLLVMTGWAIVFGLAAWRFFRWE